MGHKYDPDSARQRRIHQPRCAFCHKGLRQGAVQVDDGWRHKGCVGKVTTPKENPQPTTIREAYNWPIFQLSKEWLQKLDEWREAGKPGEDDWLREKGYTLTPAGLMRPGYQPLLADKQVKK